MLGTFRSQVEDHDTVDFPARAAAPATRDAWRIGLWRLKSTLLLAGCCLAVLPNAMMPSNPSRDEAATIADMRTPPPDASPAIARLVPETRKRTIGWAVAAPGNLPPAGEPQAPSPRLAPSPAAPLLVSIPPPAEQMGPLPSSRPEPLESPRRPLADASSPQAIPMIDVIAAARKATVVVLPDPPSEVPRIDFEATASPAVAMVLPDPPPAIPEIDAEPMALPAVAVVLPDSSPAIADKDVVPMPSPAVAVVLPDRPSAPPSAPAAPRNIASAEMLRPVDIAQISDSEVRSLRVPQLHQPGLAAGGGPTLAARIEAMQITPPPVRLSNEERALLLTAAPTHMVVRLGDTTLGKVAFRMTDSSTIDVQLAGILDLLADRYDSAEFERLRNSAAAGSYVDFDQLRAIGVSLQYDPVYDELRVTG